MTNHRTTHGDAAEPVREQFVRERRRSAFFSALAGGMAGIIAVDMWVAPQLGVAGGVGGGLLAYGLVYAWETFMWRRRHAS